MNMKRIIFAAFTVSSVLIYGCVRVESLAGSAREPSCMGKVYKLKVNCYVVRPKWKEKTLVLSPDEAVHEGLPLPVNKEHIGKSFQGELIVDIMNSGTVLQVVDIERLSSYEYNILMPHVRVIGGSTNSNVIFNAYRLFSRDTGHLDIVSKYATETKTVSGP